MAEYSIWKHVYHDDWIIEHWPGKCTKAFLEDYIRETGHEVKQDTLRSHIHKVLKLPIKKDIEEEISYLKELSSLGIPQQEATDRFNAKFGFNYSRSGILIMAKRNGINLNSCYDFYSEEEEAYLTEHRPNVSMQELVNMFNAHFGKNRSYVSIEGKCHRMKLLGPEERRGYQPGHIPWCTGMSREEFCAHLSDKSLENWLNNAYSASNSRPLGSKRTIYGATGRRYIAIKVAENEWRPYHRYIWEKVNGPIPNDHSILFLDGNSLNCELDNLVCLPKNIMFRMSIEKLHKNNPVLTKVGIRCCEIDQMISERRKDHKSYI